MEMKLRSWRLCRRGRTERTTVGEAMEIINDFQTTAMTSKDTKRGMTGGVGGSQQEYHLV